MRLFARDNHSVRLETDPLTSKRRTFDMDSHNQNTPAHGMVFLDNIA